MTGSTMTKAYITVNTSELNRVMNTLRITLTKRQFELLMYRVYKRTGAHIKTIVKRDVPKDYEAKPTWVAKNIGAPKISFGGMAGDIGCTIPIDGARGVLGSQFSAAGPRGRRKKGAKIKITARIVKGQSSTLPPVLPNQGGQPPFFNGSIVMTRKSKQRLPIVRVAGLGVPQMPMNRSGDSIQEDIINTMRARIEHEWTVMMKGIK